MPDDQPKRPPPTSADELLERYAKGERDFEDSQLAGAQLAGKNLSGTRFRRSRFSGADLRGANLRHTDLGNTFFEEANLLGADLEFSNLNVAVVRGADLSEARVRWVNCAGLMAEGAIMRGINLIHTNLKWARLKNTDLREAWFVQAVLDQVNLEGARLDGATFGETVLGACALARSQGLELAKHREPSVLSIDFLAGGQGRIPTSFLRGCGLSDWEILNAKLYDPELSADERTTILYEIDHLLREQPVSVNPLFIAYSRSDQADDAEKEDKSRDSAFVDAIGKALDDKGIRYWRDVHHATSGRLDKIVDRAMRLNPTALIVLSPRSLASDWVESEVKKARDLELELGRDVLCPVVIGMSSGDALANIEKRWGSTIKRQVEKYNVLDFSDWENQESFKDRFQKLLHGLHLHYRKSDEPID